MAKDKTSKLVMSGAIAGFATPYLLKYVVVPVLNMLGKFVPAFSLKLAEPGTIAINIRESLTGINGGLAGWLMDVVGITVPESMITTALISAVGGALLFLAGGYLADAMGMLKGNAVAKTRTTIFAGSIVAALILGTMGLPPELDLNLVNVLLAMLVNAGILAWLYGILDPKGQMGLIPY